MESINDIDLKNVLQNLLYNLNQNNSYRENNDFFKRAFFILNIPIKAYDLLNMPNDIKESIEIIDFPGLDSVKNIFYSEVLNHLLQFSDGFIFVNKGNSIMEAEKVKNLNKIIQLIIQNKKNEFSFKSCLFILNRCDEVEINIEDSKKEYERIFEINSREKTFNEIIAISKKLKDLDNINITKFSNTLYYEFKSFMKRINDYDNYLNEYEIKIDKKYVGKKYLMFLKKKIYEDVCTIYYNNHNYVKNEYNSNKQNNVMYYPSEENESTKQRNYDYSKKSLYPNTKRVIDTNYQDSPKIQKLINIDYIPKDDWAEMLCHPSNNSLYSKKRISNSKTFQSNVFPNENVDKVRHNKETKFLDRLHKTQITTLPGCVKRGKYDIKDDKNFNVRNSESYLYKMERDFSSNVHFGPLTKEEEEIENHFPIEQRYQGSYQRGVKDNDIFNLKMNKGNNYEYVNNYGYGYNDVEEINNKGKRMFKNNNTFKSQIEFA